MTNIDNDTRWVNYIRLGAITGVGTGTRGTYYFDAFESRRNTYIGLASILGARKARIKPVEPESPEASPEVESTPALTAATESIFYLTQFTQGQLPVVWPFPASLAIT